MKGYVTYDPATGGIESTTIVSDYFQMGGTSTTSPVYPLPTDESYVVITDPLEDDIAYKVDLSTLTIVPQTYIDTPLAISATTSQPIVINGLPDCTAEYKVNTLTDTTNISTEYLIDYLAEDEITDGTLNLTIDLAGSYLVVLSSPIYLVTIVVITVEDA